MQLPLNLTYLKYFHDAVELGGISSSAKANFVSQSAVSQAIAKLEDALEKKLFTYQSKKLRLTDEGHIVIEKSKDIFNSIETLEDALTYQSKSFCGRVKIGCSHSFALALLPDYMKKLKEAYPLIDISFSLCHTNIIKDKLKKCEIDFGIVLDNDDFSGFKCLKIHEGEYNLYASEDYDIKNISVIASEDRPEVNKLKEYYFVKYKKELPTLMKVSSWEVISNLAASGLGAGFIPDYIVISRDELRKIDLQLPSIPYKIFAIMPSNQETSENVEAVLKIFN